MVQVLTGCCPNEFYDALDLLRVISIAYWFYWYAISLKRGLRLKFGFGGKPVDARPRFCLFSL